MFGLQRHRKRYQTWQRLEKHERIRLHYRLAIVNIYKVEATGRLFFRRK